MWLEINILHVQEYEWHYLLWFQFPWIFPKPAVLWVMALTVWIAVKLLVEHLIWKPASKTKSTNICTRRSSLNNVNKKPALNIWHVWLGAYQPGDAPSSFYSNIFFFFQNSQNIWKQCIIDQTIDVQSYGAP